MNNNNNNNININETTTNMMNTVIENGSNLYQNVSGFGIKIFFLFIFMLSLYYISNKIKKKKNNCTIIQQNRYKGTYKVNTFYNIDELIRKNYFEGKIDMGDGNVVKYDYKLKDFYIKTAYNCFCSGNFKNDYVDDCALKNCASYGVRALDMQLFSIKNKPIVSSTAINTNIYKQGYNKITFRNALIDINNIFYQSEYFEENGNDDIKNNLTNDPLFLILRLHYGGNDTSNEMESNTNQRNKQKKFYNKIYNILTKQFPMSKFASTYFKANYGTNYERSDKVPNIKMKDTKDKIFIFVILNNEPNYETIKESKLDDIVNLYGDDLTHYRINELSDTDSGYDINKYKTQEQLTYCMPAWSSKYTNYDFTKAMKKGTQFVGLNFQNLDEYLNYYNNFFINQFGNKKNDITSPYIKKPDHMIELPLKIRIS